MKARVLQIRRRVAAVAVTVFIALFAGIYVQMASGDDPALETATKAATTTTTTDTPSAVTTRQS